MSYAIVQDVAASWEQYQPLAGAMDGALPDGLIIHIAGRTDEGYRVIEVWEDETAWECFQAARPAPPPSLIQIPQLQPTFRDLRAEHIVVGRGFRRRRQQQGRAEADHARQAIGKTTTDTRHEGGTMRLITIGLILAAATALAAGALAAPTAADPMRLALQKADVPAGSFGSGPTRNSASSLAPLGVRGLKGASWQYLIPAGGEIATTVGPLPKEWSVSGDVFVAPTVAAARSLFRLGKRAKIGFFSDTAGTPRYTTLPSYGDEQMAYTTVEVGKLQASVFVRKGAVVWQLRATSSPRQWRASRAQVLAQLTLYATKVKRRVGRG